MAQPGAEPVVNLGLALIGMTTAKVLAHEGDAILMKFECKAEFSSGEG